VAGAGTLSEREREVLRWLARGADNPRIAAALTIAEGTVKNHVSNIYGRLGVRSRAQAAAWAWQHGLLREDGVPD
jgi:DNA-binding NarL/FixJ family response regulator